MATSPEKVIIDVDVGLDDYLALFMLIQAEKLGQIVILGIICTMGNTQLNNVVTNVVRLLEITNRTDIPVFKGAHSPLIAPPSGLDDYFGTDGFCDLTYDSDPDLSLVNKTPAAVAIAQLLAENSGDVTLLGVAPLTNVALYSKIYHDYGYKFKDIWLMGGNIKGTGNVFDYKAEFNFYLDVEGVFVAFDSLLSTQGRYLLPWETCNAAKISLDWLFFAFGAKTDPAIQLFMRAATKFYTEMHTEQTSWGSCDTYLVASYLYKDKLLSNDSLSAHNMSIELQGKYTRGQLLLDIDDNNGKMQNVTVIESFDLDKFKEILLNL